MLHPLWGIVSLSLYPQAKHSKFDFKYKAADDTNAKEVLILHGDQRYGKFEGVIT